MLTLTVPIVLISQDAVTMVINAVKCENLGLNLIIKKKADRK